MSKLNCPHCEKPFKNGAGLSAHLRAFHKEEPTKALVLADGFQCDQCEALPFGTEQGLKIHKVRMHSKKKAVKSRPSSEEPAVVTNYCPCCGFNLKLLAHAMAAIGNLQNG